MKKLAIIGASYLQMPLIEKAKTLGIETHVFAWAANDVGEKAADYFYPISIIDKELILEKCREIKIDGICSIASDLAAVTVNYVANRLGLTGNSDASTLVSTNKHKMRLAFEKNGDPSTRSILISEIEEIDNISVQYPIIVKPTDRSGSRGITKLYDSRLLRESVSIAIEQSLEKKALIEEYIEGQEYSVEFISWKGTHHYLNMTKKYTTGEPHFIETGHIEPALVDENVIERVKAVVTHALDSLQVENGASHSEIKIDDKGNIKIVEIGARMGGDFIGSDLVYISTGVDFVKAVIDIALGNPPELKPANKEKAAGVKFIFDRSDIEGFKKVEKEHPEFIITSEIYENDTENEVTNSANRHGYYIMWADDIEKIRGYFERK